MSHADPPLQRPRARERSRSSFLKRRSFFGGRPESMSFDPIAAAPQQTFKASSPAAAPPLVQGHILYHDLVPTQRAEETPVQHKRRSIFSVFKLGSKKQDHSQPVFEYQQPRRDPSSQYTEQLARTQHIRGPSLPVGVNDVQRVYSGEDDCVSTRPFSLISAVHHTDAESDYHAHKKASISPPFNFQHVTHTHKKHLPALDTVAEKDLTKEFWQAPEYQTPQTQLYGVRTQDLGSSENMGLRDMVASRVLPSGRSQSRPPGERSNSRPPQANERSQSRPAAPMERSHSRPPIGAERSQSRPAAPMERSQSRPPGMESLDRVRSKSREEITALPGLASGKKASGSKRRDDPDALLGVVQEKASVPRPEGLRRAESVRPKNDSSTSLRGFDFGLRPTRSHSTSSKRTEKSFGEDGSAAMLGFGFSYSAAKRSAETSRSNEKTSQDGGRPGETNHRAALSSLTLSKERTHSGSSSTAPKRDDVNALLGISPKDAKRQSKQVEKQAKQQEANALLGIRSERDRSQSKSRQPPAPLRPRRSDEALKSIRYEATPPASSQSLSTSTSYAPSPTSASSITPHRPLRVGQDEEVLNEMGLAQLLYRPDSNESRHSPITPVTPVQYAPRYSEEQRRVSIDAESVYPPDTYEADHTAGDLYSQQAGYRNDPSVPAMPSIPSHYMTSREARGPLQTVVEHAEYVSPLQSPTGSAMSPVSQHSAHSARLINPRSPELTGPNMPDDETWMDEIDFLYKQNAEATNDFDWDNVSMTPHRLSTRESGQRLSLNMPSLNVPNTDLVKKLSEGSLRQSYHLPSSRTSKDLQYIHRDFHNPRKAPSYEARLNDTVAGARASPEVRVIDVDERVDSRQQQHDVAALQMHGYESLAAGYLSDPESASSQHRKSNSYGSWESRRSVTTQREQQQTRSSNTSVSSVPELLHARRGPKPPITSISHQIPHQQPMSPYQEPPAQHPMHEYAAFSQNPYAGGADSRPQSSHRIPNDQPPPIPFHSHPSQQQRQYTPPQEHSAAASYLSNRRPETIDENAILRAAGDAVKHGRAESRSQNRNLHYQPGWI